MLSGMKSMEGVRIRYDLLSLSFSPEVVDQDDGMVFLQQKKCASKRTIY